MATLDAILVMGQSPNRVLAALAADTSSTEQLLGSNTIFAVVADDAFHIKFGKTGMTVAAATDFLIPANTIVIFDTGSAFTHVRIFNDTTAAIEVHIQQLSRF